MMNEGIQPVVNLATENCQPCVGGYGYGYGNGMFGDGWWILLLLLAFCGNGFGFGGGYGGGYGAITNDNLLNGEFIKRDIFNTNQNVSSTACETQKDVLESRYTTQLGLQQLQASQQACCCDLGSQIADSKYASALQNQALQAQIAQCCCDLQNTIHSEGEITRALINSNTMQDLRDRLAQSQRETDTANLALQNNAQTQTLLAQINKTPIPAYLACSPFESAFYGFRNNCCGFNSCGCGCNNF